MLSFLAALAALGLPWLMIDVYAYSLCWNQSLPAFQSKPKPRKTDGGHEKPWTDQQKDNDKVKYKYKDNDNDNNNMSTSS